MTAPTRNIDTDGNVAGHGPGGHGAALEPWHPPTPPSARRTAFQRVWIAVRPALVPVMVGALSWAVSAHGGAHSKGDAAAGILLTATAAVCAAVQSTQAGKNASARPAAIGESEPHAALVTVRAGLVAWALAGLAALATIDVYTANPYLRALYTVLGAAAPLAYARLTTRHHDEKHLAYTQKLELERTAASAHYRVEQLRQEGATTRTVTRQEHETIRTRVTEDGKTTRTELRENGKTTRAVLEAYTHLTAPHPADGPVLSAGRRGTAQLSERLSGLLALSPSAASALGAETAALLGHAAATDAAQPAGDGGENGLYL